MNQPQYFAARQYCRFPRPAFLLYLLTLFTPLSWAQTPTDVGSAVAALAGTSFSARGKAIDTLAASGDVRVTKLLHALLDGRLYTRKADQRVVITQSTGARISIVDALTGASLSPVASSELKKIPTNNSQRSALRRAIARLDLKDKDEDVRRSAARQLLGTTDAETLVLLRELAPGEKNKSVRQALENALNLADLESHDARVRIKAVYALADSLDPEVHNRLTLLLEEIQAADPAQADMRDALTETLESMDFKRQLYSLAETAFFGVSLGSVLLLAAIGLAITFGVMGVINMAHGELMMLGAYTTYVVQLLLPNHIDYSLWVAIPAAFLVAGLAGIAIERSVIRFLYGRPLETLLATFGISLILQQAVRSVFSPLNRSVITPSWMSGSWEINSALSLTYNRLYIVVFALLVFAVLLLVLKYTTLGLQVRAVAQNRPMARAVGIRSGWVDAMTFGLGSGIAGVAGVALSQLTNVGPNLGQSYIIDSFMVVVFGGVGNLWGTLVGSMSLGVMNKFLEPYSGAVLAKILLLVFIILFIQKRPQGLFPQRGRAAES